MFAGTRTCPQVRICKNDDIIVFRHIPVFRSVVASGWTHSPCRQVRKRRAFANCRGIRRIRPNQTPVASEQARRARVLISNCCGFGWDAMSHADRFANAERLLTVAAFAVYSQPVKCSFVSKLPTSIRRSVCAWLIANAQILGRRFDMKMVFYKLL